MVALADPKDTSNMTPVALDQIERKRQRERERYAGMSAEQKEMNKKRRGSMFDEEKHTSPM